MGSLWYGTDPGSTPRALWAADDGQPYSLDSNSGPLDVIRDRVAEGLLASFAGAGLRAAFGHLPTALASPFPFAVVFPGTGGIALNQLTISEPIILPGQPVETGVLQTWDISLLIGIAVGSIQGDLLRLTEAADSWMLPLAEWISQNRSLGQTVYGCQHTGLTYETWQWGETTYLLAAAHLTAQAQYRLRAH